MASKIDCDSPLKLQDNGVQLKASSKSAHIIAFAQPAYYPNPKWPSTHIPPPTTPCMTVFSARVRFDWSLYVAYAYVWFALASSLKHNDESSPANGCVCVCACACVRVRACALFDHIRGWRNVAHVIFAPYSDT